MKQLILGLLVLILLCTLNAQTKNVLLIESYSADYEWDKDYADALVKGLKGLATIDRFYMNTKKIPPSEFQVKSDEAWKKYKEGKYDYVVIGDDIAFKYLCDRFSKTTTPVFFLGINNNPRNYFANKVLPAHFTGVLERPLFKRNILYLKEICPEIKKIIVLFDDGETSKIVKQEYFENQSKTNLSGVEIDIKLIGQFDDWKKEIDHVNTSYDAVIIGLYQTLKDQQGKNISDTEVLGWSVNHLKKKPFGFWEFSVGKDKTIGGLVLSGEEQGRRTAALMKKYDGSHKMPIIETSENGKLIFSKSGLDKWKIKLPESVKKEAVLIE